MLWGHFVRGQQDRGHNNIYTRGHATAGARGKIFDAQAAPKVHRVPPLPPPVKRPLDVCHLLAVPVLYSPFAGVRGTGRACAFAFSGACTVPYDLFTQSMCNAYAGNFTNHQHNKAKKHA